MIRALFRGVAAVLAAGAAVAVTDTASAGAATQLICVNAQRQFITCPVGTVPVGPYHSTPVSTRPSAARTAPSTVPGRANVPTTTPALDKPPVHTPTAGTRPSKHAHRATQPLPLGIDLLLLTVAPIGLGVQLKNRSRLSPDHSRSKGRDILSAATVGAVLAGLALLVVGVVADSTLPVYGSIGCTALAVVMLVQYRAAARAASARLTPAPLAPVAGTPSLSATALTPSHAESNLLPATVGSPERPLVSSRNGTTADSQSERSTNPRNGTPANPPTRTPANPPTRTPAGSRTRTLTDSGVQIAGAPGYSTFTGPAGKPLAQGKPWDRPCQPIVIQVETHISDAIFTQIVDTVKAAQIAGLNVTWATREFPWEPILPYPIGQTDAPARFVPILAEDSAPLRLPNGDSQHTVASWDAQIATDGRHEYLTNMQATMWPSELDGHPDRVRIATRQLIALAQGVAKSTAAGSGIARGTTVDSFSQADLHAMRLMSGCD